ncbi:MAG: TraB/GumN family protein [Erysipelothrix sp.]|nr:TraB/GumN family protein [Erysipelothrix sp.]
MEKILLNDKEITLIKTAHVSLQSVEDVKLAIEEIQPDTVCIELDDARAQNLFNKQDMSSMELKTVIKEKKVVLMVVNYILAQYQKKMADQMETNVGDEMRMGVTKAKEIGAHISYIDRNIQITFKRIWSHLTFSEKLKLLSSILFSLFDDETIDEATIEEMKQQDILDNALKEVSDEIPKIAEILIFERDAYMAQAIKNSPGNKIVVVIGAAHAAGIKKHLFEADIKLKELEHIKEPSWLSKQVKWLLPLSIILLVFVTTGFNLSGLLKLSGWLIAAAVASAIGALICLAHPVTILVSFLTAPIGTLSPVLAVGWFAGLSEATFRKATVADFNSLNEDSKSIKKALKNNILRTLLIMLMTSLFSSIVTITFSFDIVRQFIVSLFA